MEVFGVGWRHLEFAGHDGRGAGAFEVIGEAEVRDGGWALRVEDGCVRVGSGDGVVDGVALVVEVEGEEGRVVRSEAVGVSEDGELIVMLAVEGGGTFATVGGAGALESVAV